MALTELSAAFKDGALVPQPDGTLSPFSLDGTGGDLGVFSWPTSVPSGTENTTPAGEPPRRDSDT